jgi:DNA-binding LacI/PurR family transcriptional regulator
MVSYVLSDSNRTVAPETRQKILNAISELGYRPNKFAQALSMSNRGALADRHIGIVMRNTDMLLRPYYTEILAGIHSASHEKGYHVRFIRFFDELKDPILFNQLIHSEEICGLLLVDLAQCLNTQEDWRLIEQVRSRINQIVCVEWQMSGLSSVSFDRRSAAVQVTNYLFNQGYHDIAYLGESDQRVTGFKQAFLEKGAKDISGLYIADAGDMASGYIAIKELYLKNGTMPRAIFAGSDEVAVGILRFLHEQGINIPEEIAVISIDNIEISSYTHPQLTTMNVQKHAMGFRAVEMIVNRSAGQGENALTLLLPTDLIVRKSA